jgi:DNA-binding transcriptional regulator YiaG
MSEPDKPEQPELTPEEKEELSKLKRKVSRKEYMERLIEKRGGHVTYAQRQAARRAKRVAAEKKRDEAQKERQASIERRQRAYDLWVGGMSKAQISVELAVSYQTVLNWLKGRERPTPEQEEPDPINTALDREVVEAIADERMKARDEEEIAITTMAENHDKPSDKYQAYVAATAIRILRDNVALVRGPRTVRELSELDQLIRRNLGLNPKGGGGSEQLHIDISILNNTRASKGAIGKVVTVHPI